MAKKKAQSSTLNPPSSSAYTGGFTFRDERGLLYRVQWDGRHSQLYVSRCGAWTHLRPVRDEELEIFMAHESHPPEVECVGRNFFLVRSLSRPDISHIVDLDPNTYGEAPACSCEQNRFRKCKCRHLMAVEEYLATA